MNIIEDLNTLANHEAANPLEDIFLSKAISFSDIHTIRDEIRNRIISDSLLNRMVNIKEYDFSFDKLFSVNTLFEEGHYFIALKDFYNFILLNQNHFELMDKDVPAIAGYRIRKSNTIIKDSREMHFPPSDKISLVKSGRFSIPGISTLYIGSSPEICLLEMRENPKSKLKNINNYICKYYIETYGKKGFGLTRTANDTALMAIQNMSKVNPQDYLNSYYSYDVPLKIFTSIMSENDTYFKKEHVIPQFLMIVLREMGYSYFKYRSSVSFKLNCDKPIKHFLDKNYAIFDKTMVFNVSEVQKVISQVSRYNKLENREANPFLAGYTDLFEEYYKNSWIGKQYRLYETKNIPYKKIT